MPKQIIIAEQHRLAAVFSEEQIQELIVAKGAHQISDIYLGIVENVVPGIDAAFVNIGDSDRNGFIHVSDLGPVRLRRSAGGITELLTPQQKVLVQVMKEPTGNKGPRLTGKISMPGRYLVLIPFGRGVNLSRRIRNENERNRLRALAILIKPAGMGLLVRTEAEGVGEDGILEDLEFLQKQWEVIQQEALSTRPPALLNRDDDFIQRVLRDVYSSDVNRIVVDTPTGIKRVKQHLMNWSSGKSPQGVLVDHHRERTSILEFFRVNAAIREALKPRVDLPSGGYIIIQPTEALTVIDVNSGSFTRSSTARETVLWTNCEAATEIARQLRLRNLAGVIIVDFIDMDTRRDQLQVIEHFNKALRSDKARPQISQLSELGLVELTRKRQGQNIYELFGRPCPQCAGLGHLVHLPDDSDDIDGESLERMGESRLSHRNSRKSSQPEEYRDGLGENTGAEDLGFGLEGMADGHPLDLMHHPSYQEKGGVNGRSRKKRRVESGSRAPIPAGLEGVSEESDLFPADEELSIPDIRTEKPERTRVSRREIIPPTPAEPLEVVSVEMTQDEQEVYAIMGISPLAMTTMEVKDPRNTLVSVILPGQAPLSVTEINVNRPLTRSRTLAVSAELPELPLIINGGSLVSPEPEKDVKPATTPLMDGGSLVEGEDTTEDSTRRRRRRPSSVVEDSM